jgi:large subunit ribosomal protein L19e
MNLSNKKALAAKVLEVGKGRIIFSEENLSEIKEAITRQDIVDLYKSGAISIREIKGRRTNEKRKRIRKTGKVKKKVKQDKREYIIMTRKLRTYSKFLHKTDKIDAEKHQKIRRMIRAKKFKSKRHLNEMLEEI